MATAHDITNLFRAVYVEPGDDTPRLVLADALEETDDPDNHLRAKLIRLQISGEDKLRQLDILRAEGDGHKPNWMRWYNWPKCVPEVLYPFDDGNNGFHVPNMTNDFVIRPWLAVRGRPGNWYSVKYVRGFPGEITVDWEHWNLVADDLTAVNPITKVVLTNPPEVQVTNDKKNRRWAYWLAGHTNMNYIPYPESEIAIQERMIGVGFRGVAEYFREYINSRMPEAKPVQIKLLKQVWPAVCEWDIQLTAAGQASG